MEFDGRKNDLLMKTRWKRLDRYKKGLLLFLAAMVLVFTVLYAVNESRLGFAYAGEILLPTQENGSTVYTGRIDGRQARFTVSADGTVVFQYAEKTYGPYSVVWDPAAVPKEDELAQFMDGVEVYKGDELLFRGGAVKTGETWYLVCEDGSFAATQITYSSGDGLERDTNGNLIDPMEPTVRTILELLNGPALTHKGDGAQWYLGIFLCVIDALSILFAEDIVRWKLSFTIRDAEQAELTELQIVTQKIGATIMTFIALAAFASGLR